MLSSGDALRPRGFSVLSARRGTILPRDKRAPTSGPMKIHAEALAENVAGEAQEKETDPDAVNRIKMPARDYDKMCPEARLMDMGVPFRGVEDMIGIDNLNEESILLNLHRRYEEDQIYTYTGSILVSVNPYKYMPIYTMKYVKEYMGKPMGSLPPHIYATANAAYTSLTDNKKNQAVIISGESGAGKTEATKLIMQFLAQCTNKHSEVERRVLEANPVLEAFGNAATVRNNNSSRFGRFIELRFSDTCSSIEGAKVTNYLLEKSRIVKQANGERNYHVFYMLLAGCSPAEKAKYHLKAPADYHYLNQSDVFVLPNVDDRRDWERMKVAMTQLGISQIEQHSIFSLLAGILNLGNINFTQDAKNSAKIADESVVEVTAQLFGVTPHALKEALLSRLIVAGSEKMMKELTPAEAVDSRDTLAKALYDRLFGWLIAKINSCIRGSYKEDSPFIGILDIFGFENFDENSFEQLCINYTNESLQQHFNHHIFKLEQKEYAAQGLLWTSITFNDNQKCLDLIEGASPPGVLLLLDEEARFPKGTDDSFLDKLVANHKQNAHFQTPAKKSPWFIVKHYAGDVTYQVAGFLEKNRDPLGTLLISCMQGSQIELLKSLFPEDLRAPIRSNRTVGSAFRTQLKTLMDLLSSTEPHYVRCIKPNLFKIQRCFDAELVYNQLRYAGMMETIKIRKAGFPLRQQFDQFFFNYRVLSPITRFSQPPSGNFSIGCRMILDTLVSENSGLVIPDQYYIGTTKVLMKDSQYSILDNAKRAVLNDYVFILQRCMRANRDRRRFLRKRRAVAIIAKMYRAYKARSQYVKVLKAARKIQNWYRLHSARRRYQAQKKAALVLQSCWRRVKPWRAYKSRSKISPAPVTSAKEAGDEKKPSPPAIVVSPPPSVSKNPKPSPVAAPQAPSDPAAEGDKVKSLEQEIEKRDKKIAQLEAELKQIKELMLEKEQQWKKERRELEEKLGIKHEKPESPAAPDLPPMPSRPLPPVPKPPATADGPTASPAPPQAPESSGAPPPSAPSPRAAGSSSPRAPKEAGPSASGTPPLPPLPAVPGAPSAPITSKDAPPSPMPPSPASAPPSVPPSPAGPPPPAPGTPSPRRAPDAPSGPPSPPTPAQPPPIPLASVPPPGGPPAPSARAPPPPPAAPAAPPAGPPTAPPAAPSSPAGTSPRSAPPAAGPPAPPASAPAPPPAMSLPAPGTPPAAPSAPPAPSSAPPLPPAPSLPPVPPSVPATGPPAPPAGAPPPPPAAPSPRPAAPPPAAPSAPPAPSAAAPAPPPAVPPTPAPPGP